MAGQVSTRTRMSIPNFGSYEYPDMMAGDPDQVVRALASLSGRQTQAPSDAFVARRANQIATGEDMYSPSELDQRLTQMKIGASGWTPSREMIRESGMQSGVQTEQTAAAERFDELRKALGVERAKGEAQAETETIKQQGAILAQREKDAAAASRPKTIMDLLLGQRENLRPGESINLGPGTGISRDMPRPEAISQNVFGGLTPDNRRVMEELLRTGADTFDEAVAQVEAEFESDQEAADFMQRWEFGREAGF